MLDRDDTVLDRTHDVRVLIALGCGLPDGSAVTGCLAVVTPANLLLEVSSICTAQHGLETNRCLAASTPVLT